MKRGRPRFVLDPAFMDATLSEVADDGSIDEEEEIEVCPHAAASHGHGSLLPDGPAMVAPVDVGAGARFNAGEQSSRGSDPTCQLVPTVTAQSSEGTAQLAVLHLFSDEGILNDQLKAVLHDCRANVADVSISGECMFKLLDAVGWDKVCSTLRPGYHSVVLLTPPVYTFFVDTVDSLPYRSAPGKSCAAS